MAHAEGVNRSACRFVIKIGFVFMAFRAPFFGVKAIRADIAATRVAAPQAVTAVGLQTIKALADTVRAERTVAAATGRSAIDAGERFAALAFVAVLGPRRLSAIAAVLAIPEAEFHERAIGVVGA